jgi:CHAT domain-containing protein
MDALLSAALSDAAGGRADLGLDKARRAVEIAKGNRADLARAYRVMGVVLTLGNQLASPRVGVRGADVVSTQPATTPATWDAGTAAAVPEYAAAVPEYADDCLRAAARLAAELGDAELQAVVWCDRGNLLASARMDEQAIATYRRAMETGTSPEVHVRSAANASAAAARLGRVNECEELAGYVRAHAGELSSSSARSGALLECARAMLVLSATQGADRQASLLRSAEMARDAGNLADARGDAMGSAYSRLVSCEVYLSAGRLEDALTFARQASFYAQQTRRDDATYQSQRLVGKVLAAQGQLEPSLAAYRRAVEALQRIRADLVMGGGNVPGSASFRERAGAVYYEMADVLIRSSKADADQAVIESKLREARDTVELLKGAELDDYFRDRCVSAARARRKQVQDVGAQTAVIYLIPLEDRTEILVAGGKGAGMQRVTVDCPRSELEEDVRTFRRDVVTRATNRYRQSGRKLYDLIIRPLIPELEKQRVETLVFVPDGVFRSIPMSALWDGKSFLISRYAVAVSPGLDLMEPRPISQARGKAYVGGVSEARQGFSRLAGVPTEVRNVAQSLGADAPAVDENFTRAAVASAVESQPYSVVHIASHGSFGDSASETFILTYDDKLYMDDLRDMFQPSLFRTQPVELLTLSACETAAGSDRAALGMAGMAVKSGARSALATLWLVDDATSSMLLSSFYLELNAGPGVSKATALRKAQQHVISEGNTHPYFWAPFLLIGNWL